MKSTFVGLVAVSLLSLAASQLPLTGPCSLSGLSSYAADLPKAEACSAAVVEVFTTTPNPTTQEETFEILCTPDCGGALLRHAALTCFNSDVAFTFLFFCLPADTDINRCRFALPDAQGTTINSLTSCMSFNSSNPTCPNSCNTSLQAFVDEVGCCYQSLYTDPGIVEGFLASGTLTNMTANILTAINDSLLFTTCGVTRPSFCIEDPFPGNSDLVVGTCTNSRVAELATGLSSTCTNGLLTIFSNPFATIEERENAYEDICTENCAGTLSRREVENCQADFESALLANFCLQTNASLGDRCAVVLLRSENAPFFTNAATCFSYDPEVGECPAGCQAALRVLTENLGCCYQSFYNDTRFLDYLLVTGEAIDLSERGFFALLGSDDFWRACDIPLIEKCDPNPFSSAGILFPSTAILILTVFFSTFF